jgi:hypothetical protein
LGVIHPDSIPTAGAENTVVVRVIIEDQIIGTGIDHRDTRTV